MGKEYVPPLDPFSHPPDHSLSHPTSIFFSSSWPYYSTFPWNLFWKFAFQSLKCGEKSVSKHNIGSKKLVHKATFCWEIQVWKTPNITMVYFLWGTDQLLSSSFQPFRPHSYTEKWVMITPPPTTTSLGDFVWGYFVFFKILIYWRVVGYLWTVAGWR